VLGDVTGVTDLVVCHVCVRVCDFSMRCCGVCGLCHELLLEVECQRVLSESSRLESGKGVGSMVMGCSLDEHCVSSVRTHGGV
jgi:hypothetical protein